MNSQFAAGLFDSPWVIAAIVIIGAFVNWLSQLRQQKQQRKEDHHTSGGESESPQKPPGGFDVEEALRRLLGEEEVQPAPPPIPRPAKATPAPPVRRATPTVLVPPPVAVSSPLSGTFDLGDVEKQATARLAQTMEKVRQHQAAGARVRRKRGGQWSGLWRDRSSMRRAYVSSLVMGPPKGLEP